MIGYITLGTNDIDKAAAFYDALFDVVGEKRIWDSERFIGWGNPDKPAAMFSVIKPHDGQPATVGNGTMVALRAKNKEQVDALYHKALELGGTDEGAPGFRMEPFYGAYFRDLDGNKIAAYHFAKSQ